VVRADHRCYFEMRNDRRSFEVRRCRLLSRRIYMRDSIQTRGHAFFSFASKDGNKQATRSAVIFEM